MMSSSDSWTDPAEGDEPPIEYGSDDADAPVHGVDPAAVLNGNGNHYGNGNGSHPENGNGNGSHPENANGNGVDRTDEHPLVSDYFPDGESVPDSADEVLGLDGVLHSWPSVDGDEMPATAKLQAAIAEHIAVFTEDEVDDSWVEWPAADEGPNHLPRFGGSEGHRGSGTGGHVGHGGGDEPVNRPPQPPFADPVASASDQPGQYPGPDQAAGDSWDAGGPPSYAPQPQHPSQQPPPQPTYQQAPPARPPAPAVPAPLDDQIVDGPMPVDQVAVRKLGGFNFLSVSQWAALPRDERARLIKGDSVIFLNEGESVPLRSALLFFKSLNSDPGDGRRRR